MDGLEKNVGINNIKTPLSNPNTRYEKNQNDENNKESYEGNGTGDNNSNNNTNPENPSSDHYQRDVEISSGLDNNGSANPNNQGGFGF